jgi:hypothetical protein
MDRREREAILGEHGLYGENPRERGLVRRLAGDLEGSPLRGKPLPRRLRNFRPAVDAYVAGLHGLPAHLERLRQIETLSAEHEGRLAHAWERLATRHARDPAGFARAWYRFAQRWNFGAVNELIDRHNRWYPAEARLPMDPRTGDFVLVDEKPYRRCELDAGWVLERFPPELERAA